MIRFFAASVVPGTRLKTAILVSCAALISACGSGSNLDSGISTVLTPDDAIALIASTEEVVGDIGLLDKLQQFSPTAQQTIRAKDALTAACTIVSDDPDCTGTVTFSATFPLQSTFGRFPANAFFSELYENFQAADVFAGGQRTVEIRYDFLTEFPTSPPFSGRIVVAIEQSAPEPLRASNEYRFENLNLVPSGAPGSFSVSGAANTTFGTERNRIRYDFRGWSTGVKTVGATLVIEGEGLFSTGGSGFADILVVESTTSRTVYQVVGKATAGARTDTRFVTETLDANGVPGYSAR